MKLMLMIKTWMMRKMMMKTMRKYKRNVIFIFNFQLKPSLSRTTKDNNKRLHNNNNKNNNINNKNHNNNKEDNNTNHNSKDKNHSNKINKVVNNNILIREIIKINKISIKITIRISIRRETNKVDSEEESIEYQICVHYINLLINNLMSCYTSLIQKINAF